MNIFEQLEIEGGADNAFARLDQGKKKEDIGRGTAFLTAAEQGLNANFADEKRGVQAAAGTPDELRNPFSGPADFVTGLAKLGYEYLVGGDDAAKKYAAARDEFRKKTKEGAEQYPVTSAVGNAAGALLIPAGGMLNAATMPARMARGAAVGAGYGGAAGIGEGEGAVDRASRGAVGAGLGAVAGGVGVPVVEGITRGVAAIAARPVNMVRSAIDPDAAAERAVGRAFNEAATADPQAINRVTQAELARGGPATVLDTLGAPGRDLARSAGNISGGARDTLNQTLNDRFESQVPRLTHWLRTTFNYPDAHAQQVAIDGVERTVNRVAYARAYRDGDRGLWSPELERLTSSPDVVAAMRDAATRGKSRAVTQGFGGFNSGVTFENDILRFGRGPTGQPSYPTLQFWDYTKRSLDDAANAARRSGRNEEASTLGQLSTALRGELDHLVPTYQQARAGAAAFFGAENALEAGQNFVRAEFALPQTRAALARMTPNERQLFQDGFVSRLIETLENVPDRADIVRRIYNTPSAREKIQLALGPNRARELEAILRIENIMQQGLRGVQGNSTTTQQLVGLGLAGGGAGAVGGGMLGFDPTTSGIVAALTAAGKRGVDQRVALSVARLLASNDPALITRAVRLVSNNGRFMDALRSADAAAAKIGGGQVQAVQAPAIQIPAIGRSENEPEVPRPPGQ